MYGGLEELYGERQAAGILHLKREFKEYFDAGVEKGWQIVPKHRAAHPLRGRRQPTCGGCAATTG